MSEAGVVVEMSSEVINQLLPNSTPEKKIELLSSEEIPIWLNDLFIENILRKFFNDRTLKVKCLKIQQCGGKGDSYASLMFRVGAFYFGNGESSEKFKSLIVKTLPEQDMALEKLGSGNYNVQNKEMEMYQKLLPEFKNILESIKEDSNIFPACLAVDKALDVIVLEDLVEKKFVMADRIKNLDLEHIKISLKKLARMHAASIVLHQKHPKSFDNFDTGFFTRKTDVFHVMFESLCDNLIEEIQTWKGYEYFAAKLKNVRKNLIKNAQRAFDCDDGDLHVLTHGDLWTNNIMFSYDDSGSPSDAVLLDFQFACYGSPALDLIYFLFTSTVEDDRVNKMEELFQFYYYELKSLLTRLNHDMQKFPSLHSFQLLVRKKYFYVFTSCLLIFPVMISQDKDADFESLQGLDERSMGFKRRIFQNPKYQSVAKKILPMLDRRGILDEM